jgi:hypothetical protein
MAIKTFSSGEVLTSSDTNTYLNNGGLVYITQTVITAGSSTAVSFNNCFSATYDNYRILIDGFQPSVAGTACLIRMRVGGVDASGAADYFFAETGLYVNGASAASNGNGLSYGDTGLYNSANTLGLGSASLDIFNPFKAERTFYTGNSILYNTNFGVRSVGGVHNVLTSYDGFSLINTTASNFTKIRVRIYGYRNA